MNRTSLHLFALTLSLGACNDEIYETTPVVSSANPPEAGVPTATVVTNDAAFNSDELSLATSTTLETETSVRTPPPATNAAQQSTESLGVPDPSDGASDANTASSTSHRDVDPTPAPAAPIGSRNFVCEPSPSPMFQGQEVLQMHIAADFSVINGNNKESAKSAGLLDPDGPGPLAPIPVEIHARGVSRFRECGFRPFKVKFADKQKGNVFQKLGKSVKFSTHCGDREGMHEVLRAPSLDEYYQRVRMEHLVYQLLLPLETMSLATRLVSLTYEDTHTGTAETHLAFVREPEDELGQRCGMLEGEDIPDDPTTLNERANLLLNLLNNFVLQADVKNRFDLVDAERHLRSPVPYDFDLLGIFRRDYPGLRGRTLLDNAEAFGDWLRRNQSAALQEEVRLLLSKADVMRQTIANAELSPSNRALFDEWLSMFLGVLETFANCQASTNDPALGACYIADDHADTIAEAVTVNSGEHTLILEPPGDRDVVLVRLESERLYTVTTSVEVTWRDPDETVVGRLDQHRDAMATALSLRTNAGGMYSLEFDLGSSLVCSDMWNNDPDVLAQPYAVYEDDHGGTLSTATALGPNTTTTGSFELDTLRGLFDEDWFTLTVDSDTRVFVETEDADSAFIEIYATNQLDVAIDTHFVSQGREELTRLFPSEGDYLLRAVQGWDRASYSLHLLTADE